MALRSGLTCWCYTAPTGTASQPLTVVPYKDNVQALRFTTLNPGGYGEFSFDVYVGDARIPRPELQIFSRCVIKDGLRTVFVGEITDPPVGIEPGREFIRVKGLGLGNCLRDDPRVVTYTNQTAQQVAKAELAYRTGGTYNSLPLDADATLLFPDNPAATNSPGYDNKTMEDVLTDLCLNASNTTNLYAWWTQAHAVNVDAAGFATLQVVAKREDFATASYQASLMAHEVTEYAVEPSADRSANHVGIGWNNGTGGVNYNYSTDPRLAGDFSQGTAPFRMKKIIRDLSSTPTITSPLATQIATWLRTEYQNGSNKVRIKARAMRDGNGNPIELWAVNAFNTNIAVPEAAVRGATLPTSYTAGVNLFHVKQTTYSETASYAEVQLDCDNFADGAAAMIARLQTAADIRLRSPKTGGDVQANGQPIQGQCGAEGVATGAQSFGVGVTFPQQAATTPSVVNLTQLANTNVANATVSQRTALGFHLTVTTSGAGAYFYEASYLTVGN